MIDIRIMVQWPDYEWRGRKTVQIWKPKDEHYRAHVSSEMYISETQWEDSFHLSINEDPNFQEQERRFKCGNRGIYDGANCRQFVQFLDGDEVLKEFAVQIRPGKTRLQKLKPKLELWLEHAKQLVPLNNLK